MAATKDSRADLEAVRDQIRTLEGMGGATPEQLKTLGQQVDTILTTGADGGAPAAGTQADAHS
jgi:hypothetical protein